MPNDDTLLHPDQPRFLFPTWIWAVTLFVFFAVIVAITFAAMSRGSTYEGERADARVAKLKTAREDWDKAANTYGWVDQAKGVAHIPIARAMEVELADLQARKPEAAGPIGTPAPDAAPVTATGAAQPANPTAVAPAASATPKATTAEGNDSEGHNQPAAAANPPSAPRNTQPGVGVTPAANPKSKTEIAPITPTATPAKHPVGTPIPVRGAGSASPAPRATSSPQR